MSEVILNKQSNSKCEQKNQRLNLTKRLNAPFRYVNFEGMLMGRV